MRERRKALPDGIVNVRITPAYAGKTKKGDLENGSIKDHPRVCGKDAQFRDLSDLFQGSPPRMRERLTGNRA